MLVGDTFESVVALIAFVVPLLLLLMKQNPGVAQFPTNPVQATVTAVVAPVTKFAGDGVVTENVPIAAAATAVTVSVALTVTPAASVTSSVIVGLTDTVEVTVEVSMVTLSGSVGVFVVKVFVVTPAPVIWQVCAAQSVPLNEKFTGTTVDAPAEVTVVAGVLKFAIFGAAFTCTDLVSACPAAFVTVSA